MVLEVGQRVRLMSGNEGTIVEIVGGSHLPYGVKHDGFMGTFWHHYAELTPLDPIYEIGDAVIVQGELGKLIRGTVKSIGETYPVRYTIECEGGRQCFAFALEMTPYVEPETHLYLYASPHPLMLTPDDTDVTDLLMANARLLRRFTETAYQSVEVMRAMGEVCRLTKAKLAPFIDLMEEDQ